jgi:hypothetical protein
MSHLQELLMRRKGLGKKIKNNNCKKRIKKIKIRSKK